MKKILSIGVVGILMWGPIEHFIHGELPQVAVGAMILYSLAYLVQKQETK